MEEVFANLCSDASSNLWRTHNYSSKSVFEVSELWLDQQSGALRHEERPVMMSGLSRWLEEQEIPANGGHSSESLLVRMVWVKIDVEGQLIDLNKNLLMEMLDAFGVRLAYDYFQSFITGIFTLPPTSTADYDRQAYAFGYAPKLAAIWSHTSFKPAVGANTSSSKQRKQQQEHLSWRSPRPPMTQCIVFAQKTEEKSLQRATGRMSNPHLCASAALPAYLFSLLFGAQIDMTQEEIKEKLRKLEAWTGYHNFNSKHKKSTPANKSGKPPSTDDVDTNKHHHHHNHPQKQDPTTTVEDDATGLSAKASGYSSKLASVRRKSKALEKLLDFMQATAKRLSEDAPAEEPSKGDGEGLAVTVPKVSRQRAAEFLSFHVHVVRDRLEMQALDTDYTLKRVEVQISALFNIITYQDTLLNINFLKATHKLTESTYRDSFSMKTLAIVTMFYLPGSFVSSLFSTELFDWDSVDLRSRRILVDVTPQMSLYWIITIALTVATFTLYLLSLLRMKWQIRRIYGRNSRGSVMDLAGHGGMPLTAQQRLTMTKKVMLEDSEFALDALHPRSALEGRA